MLRQYHGDPSHVLDFSSVQLGKDLSYVEELVAILDMQVRKLRSKNIASVEVEVDEDPTEAKKEGEDATTEQKKETKKIVEKYWDWELTNETQPIWFSLQITISYCYASKFRSPKEVSKEEYNEFYKKTFKLKDTCILDF
ncbi:uncharacterized protein [Nicotiana sylvestris]|uniref:uncharacterized protein n=1 Tax=Nicotiana sylvestris TaxID=4096 RepID=UPI00388C8289